MIRAVIRQELRGQLRDGRLWALGLAVAALLLLMLAAASQHRAQAEQERLDVETQSREQWDHQGEKNPHRGAHFGLYAFKPLSALASVDPGVDAQAGQALWLEPHKRNMAMFPPASDEPPSLGLGALTPALVLLAWVPLLALVLGHRTISEERESGTLRMLHACGMRARTLILGKWLGLWLALLIVMAPALALGGWLIGPGELASLVILGASLVLYYGLWAAIAVVVSAHSATSRTALLSLLAFWVFAVFLVPRLAASIVEQRAPLPGTDQFWAAIHHDIERGLPGDGSAAQRLRAFDAALLRDHHVTRLEELPFGANAKRRMFRDAYAARVHALHFNRLWDAQIGQQTQLRWWTVLSPLAPLRAISSALAGTDLPQRRAFEDAAEQYRQRFTVMMDEWDLQSTRGVTSFESRYAGDAQWQAIPHWSYRAPGLAEALWAVRWDFAQLLGWLTVALIALIASARKLTP